MNRQKKWIALTAVAVVLSMVVSVLPQRAEAASSSEIKKQINELEEKESAIADQISEIREQQQANADEMTDLVSQKDLIDQEISLLYEQVNLINDQIASYSLLIADKQDELDQAEENLQELNEKNKERIRTMEEEGQISYWSIIFEANSFSDLLDRLNMVQEIAAADQRRIRDMETAARKVAEAQASLEEEKTALETTRTELDAAQVELEAKREEADELLRKLIAKGEEFQTMLDESEALQEDLMAQIAKKEKELKAAEYQEWLATYVPPTTYASDDRTPSSSAPSSSGWTCPVPYYTITSAFGYRVHPIYGDWRMHNGVDMSCAQGTPIYASRSGKVTVASYQAGGAGYYVSINHGDGFSSIYMHMTHYIVSAGQYVTAGQVIGYVGSTGGSTGPHLHFGISYNGSYVNPMNYI